MEMTSSETGIGGADGENASASSGTSPLARFGSKPMPDAAKAESTESDDGPPHMPQPVFPFPKGRKAGRKNRAARAEGSSKDLAGRLIRFARPLALKHQINLAQTFGSDEAREWVRASESTLMRLPLRNASAEATGFYAELALALADERQKERGILAEPALKLVDGTSLLVDLKGKK